MGNGETDNNKLAHERQRLAKENGLQQFTHAKTRKIGAIAKGKYKKSKTFCQKAETKFGTS